MSWCPASAVVGGLSFTSSEFRDLRAHGPRIRTDDLYVPLRRFVARVSALVTTVKRRPGLRGCLPVADAAFASIFIVPPGGDQGLAGALAAATIATQRTSPPTSILQGESSAVSTALVASAHSDQASAGAPA